MRKKHLIIFACSVIGALLISAPAYADTSERYVQEQNVRIGETVIQEQETQNKECIIQTDSFVPFVESQNSEIKENIGIEIAQENDLLNNAQSLEQKDDSGSTAPSEDVSEEQKPFDDESKTEEKPSESEQGNAETVPSNPENNAEEGDKNQSTEGAADKDDAISEDGSLESEPLPPDSSDGTAPFDGDSQESLPPSETEDTVDDSLPPKNNTEESQNVTDSSEDAVSDQNSQSESAKQTGLVETENGTVYINPDGSYFTGEKYIDGKGWAYFDPANGGLMVKGWFNLDWRTVYYDNGYMAHGETLASDGNYYYFDEVTGNKTTGEKNVDQQWSYFEPETGHRVEGFYTLPDQRRVCYVNGRMIYGTNRVWGHQYDFNPVTGAIITGEGYDPQNGWYYIDETTGNMYFGEKAIGADWSYFAVDTGRRAEGITNLPDGRTVCYVNGRMVFGMQKIYGETYFFDPVDGHLINLTKGVDVSSHQGLIDWNQVKASGIQFAIIRAMSWPANGSYYQMDPYFLTNIKNARAAGIYVGAYWFSYAFNGQEAIEEVTFISNSSEWNELKKQGIVLDLPFFIDYEYSDQKHGEYMNANTTYASRTEAVRNGMVYTENVLGCRPGFYGSYNDITKWYDGLGLINEGYDCWVAQWGSTNSLGDKADIWQYSSTASVPGIKGNVDVNYCYNQDYFDSIRVYDQALGTNVQGNVQTILARLVEQEVGGMNNAEVYKAQTIAANTYIRYLLKQGKTPSVRLSARVPSSLVRGAVAAVKDELVYYNNELALTVYGSSSADTTNKAYTYGWVELPYLTNVDNKYDTQYKNMTCYVKNSDLEKGIKALGGSTEGYDPSNWIQGCVFDQYGWLKSITLCGKMYTAEQFYENSWGLYSTNFKSFTYDSANSRWVFTGVNGNGHGIGMSQYGAKGMADAGYNYKQILNHYYPGTVII